MMLECVICKQAFRRVLDLKKHRETGCRDLLMCPQLKRKSIFEGVEDGRRLKEPKKHVEGGLEQYFEDGEPEKTFIKKLKKPFLLVFTCKKCPRRFTRLGELKHHGAEHPLEESTESSESSQEEDDTEDTDATNASEYTVDTEDIEDTDVTDEYTVDTEDVEDTDITDEELRNESISLEESVCTVDEGEEALGSRLPKNTVISDTGTQSSDLLANRRLGGPQGPPESPLPCSTMRLPPYVTPARVGPKRLVPVSGGQSYDILPSPAGLSSPSSAQKKRMDKKSSVSVVWPPCCSGLAPHPDYSKPFSPLLHAQLLNKMSVHCSSLPGYTKFDERTPVLRPNSRLRLGDESFRVTDMRGEGGFAKVYAAISEGLDPDCVLKVQRPANDWEWYILHQLRQRLRLGGLEKQLGDCFMLANRCYTYTDGSILVSRLEPLGSLLDLVNMVSSVDKSVMESLALNLGKEILILVSVLHDFGFIHADLKPDNFLIRDFPDVNNSSVQIIDFGKTIDLTTLPENIVFQDLVSTSGLKCIEMREKRQWRHHIDYFGLTATIYCCLFGQYMKVIKQNGRWSIKGSFKRGWQTGFWRSFFDCMLNLEGGERSCLPNLAQWAEKFKDTFLRVENAERNLARAREILMRKVQQKRRGSL